MINLNDESIVSITKTKVNRCSYITTFREKIIYTNCKNNSVTCIDFHGNIQWVFKNESVLKHTLGISVDRDGNVYVVGGKSNNVVVISSNGLNYRQILTRENGLQGPKVIHVDRSSCRMLVANNTNAFVYNLT